MQLSCTSETTLTRPQANQNLHLYRPLLLLLNLSVEKLAVDSEGLVCMNQGSDCFLLKRKKEEQCSQSTFPKDIQQRPHLLISISLPRLKNKKATAALGRHPLRQSHSTFPFPQRLPLSLKSIRKCRINPLRKL